LRPNRALALALILIGGPAFPAGEELTIKNVGMSRTISAFGGPLRTTKLEANGVQVIRQPGVEFMIDLDYKGEPVSLAPGDFDIRDVDTIKDGNELRTSIRLQSLYDGIPLIIYLRYHRDPTGSYQQKSITILPCKEAAGAVLRRVILDDQVLKPEYVPVIPTPRGSSGSEIAGASAAPQEASDRFVFGGSSSFAAIDRDSKRGLFFFVTSLVGKEGIGRTGGLRMWQEMYVPVEQGYETGRATIGSVVGPPEILFKRFREFLWEDYCVARGRAPGPDGERVGWDKADVMAGKLPEAVAAGKARVLVLRGDEWPVASPGANESSFTALAACADACRKTRAANREAVVEVSCGVVPRPYIYTSGFANASCPGATRVHWLGVVDCLGLGDRPTWHTLPGRQARYDQAFLLPPATFGAKLDLGPRPNGPAALTKELAPYLAVYQHILDYPDGKNVDGEGHIIGNKGFIILFNPAAEPRKVAIPLDEPELELKGKVKLTDRTQPDSPADLGTAQVGEKVEVEIAPSTAKVIGVNL